MKHAIETGTDIATVCFFDRAALQEKDPGHSIDQLEKLHQELRVWRVETGADGAYLFHFYVDEPMPDRIKRYALDPIRVERYSIPSGEIWASGAEYMSSNPSRPSKGFPAWVTVSQFRPVITR